MLLKKVKTLLLCVAISTTMITISTFAQESPDTDTEFSEFATLDNDINITGEYKLWKQSDERWGSKELGSSGRNMSQIGCAVTSVAINVVHSKSADEKSFDPGKLCDYLTANSGFTSDGSIYWGKVTGLIPSFTYEGAYSLKGTTQSAKASEIAEYLNKGYVMVLSVNYSSHWVAVDSVQGDKVIMIDPAKNSPTDLFEKYDNSGVLQFRLFKGKSAIDNDFDYPEGNYKAVSNINIRKEAGTSSDILELLPMGTKVNVVETDDNWGKITYNNITGWICLDYAEFIPTYEIKLDNYVLTDNLNLRSEAGTNYPILVTMPKDSVVKVTEIKDGWAMAQYGTYKGWFSLEYAARMGDLNNDGVIDSKDAITLKNYLHGNTADVKYSKTADVNNDGLINAIDDTLLKRFISQ